MCVQYIGGRSVHQGDIMIHVGEQLDKILSISIENSDVLNMLRCTEHPLMYSWYPSMYSWYPRCTEQSPNVLMVSHHMYHDIPQCTEHPPMFSWYPPDVLMVSLRSTEHPRCTHDIPMMYSWYPPMYWTAPDVLNIPRCTEHTLYRVVLSLSFIERERVLIE